MESCWSVYLVRCSDGSLYTGISNDVPRRVKKHNAGRGARYTARRLPVVLVYTREIGTMGEAMREERRIKGLGRQAKLRLAES